eukprot:5388264-Amphidinium_carterae.1
MHSKLTAWKDFKAEVNTIKRTQANIGLLPMDLDAFSKGKAKGAKNAWEKARGKEARTRRAKARKTTCRVSVRRAKAKEEKAEKAKAKTPKGKRNVSSVGVTAISRPIALVSR